ncbi:fumarylacetoacetate hydrolase family protein [Streptomyces sp. NPDC056390]|uniref:fumarylacetoacetate hydrolase family protein n=1 Tax=Streptomyces sp. NPDC056390 TaxID=3345806 RepID=UPI0035E32C95
MHVANIAGRLSLLYGDRAIDVGRASGGRLPTDPGEAYERWDELAQWAASVNEADAEPFDESELGPPVPHPRQVFAIGLNYRDHAEETGMALPDSPSVFTKFPTCITGPRATVELPSDTVDWEVELVIVIGRPAHHVAEGHGWDHVAGLTIGQDLSERTVQLSGPPPQQFSLGKSYTGFAPLGPAVVTRDELEHPDDLAIGCSVDGEVLQSGRTGNLIFSVPDLVERLSAVCTLLPGDIIFTGTPAGVGMGRKPPRYLTAGSTLVSEIEGLGHLRNTLVRASVP